MKYRIKAYHYKNHSVYYPQWKLLWFWTGFGAQREVSFSSKIKAQEYIDNDIDLQTPIIEKIPYETNKETRTRA